MYVLKKKRFERHSYYLLKWTVRSHGQYDPGDLAGGGGGGGPAPLGVKRERPPAPPPAPAGGGGGGGGGRWHRASRD